MNNKLFVFLVVILCIMIIIALGALTYSLLKYNDALPSFESNAPEISIQNVDNTNAESIDKKEDNSNKEFLYILPSNTREITANDLKGMSKEELNRAYNEIFARYGHDFKTKSLKDYFKTQTWYKPIDGKTVTPADLTDLENKNKDIIMNRIKELEK